MMFKDRMSKKLLGPRGDEVRPTYTGETANVFRVLTATNTYTHPTLILQPSRKGASKLSRVNWQEA
jgi:hypothetical protein